MADVRFRTAIHELVKEKRELAAEFDILFPPIEARPSRGGMVGGVPSEGLAGAKNARMHLVGMSGWASWPNRWPERK